MAEREGVVSSTNYTVYENGSMGQVQIADEVIAIIAGIAATEVEGVKAMAGNITKDFVARLGMKTLQKGVRINVDEDQKVSVDLSMILEYGCSIPKVTAAIQEKVKSAIETMTPLEVAQVNIRVADVDTENE